jgi:hypothetical protein
MRIPTIRLRYRSQIPPGMRDKVDRVLVISAEKCPAHPPGKGWTGVSGEAEAQGAVPLMRWLPAHQCRSF